MTFWPCLAEAEEGGGGFFGGFGTIAFLFLAYFIILWFIWLRPQRRAEQKRQQDLRALSKNETVLTTGGILGVVVLVKDDEVVLRVDEKTGTRIRFLKSAIARKIESKPGDAAPSAEEEKEGAKAS